MAEFTWAPQAGRYRDVTTGRFVSPETIRAGVDALVQTSAARMADLSKRFRAGELTASDWLQMHMTEVKAVNLAAALAAKGGRSQMTPADYGRAGQQIRQQYAYSRKMVQDVLDGRQRMNGRLDVRAASYAAAARVLYENVARLEAYGRGSRQERNVIHSTETCSGCRAESDRGWVPIGSLVLIGQRSPCGPRCKCSLEYQRAGQEAIAS